MGSSLKVLDWLKSSWLTIVFVLLVVVLVIAGIAMGMGGNTVVSLTLLIGGVLVLVLLVLSRTSTSGRASGGANSTDVLVLIFLAVILVAGMALVLTRVDLFHENPEARIGAFIILGVSLLMVLLFIMATGFAMLNLADRNRALGLPEGSIRALIALLLILIFIIMGLFLYSSVATPSSTWLTALSASQVASLPSDKLIAVSPLTDTIPTYNVVYQLTGTGPITLTNITLDQVPAGATIQSQNQVSSAPTYTALIRIETTAKGADLAQQLITTVGTLVVAIAGFYFGSRTAEAAAGGETAPPAPTITDVWPAEGTAATQVSITKLSGSGFVAPVRVFLRRIGSDDIVATDAQVLGQSTITCALKLPPASDGAWDVIVVNGDNTEGKLVSAFIIKTP